MCSYHFRCSKLVFQSKCSWLTLHQVNQTWIKVVSGVYERLCANIDTSTLICVNAVLTFQIEAMGTRKLQGM
jgi:hypothetical protein